MDRVAMKKRAKELLSKNYGYCLAVTLIMSAGSLLSGGFSFSTNINLESTTPVNPADLSQFQNIIETLFTNPFVIIGAVVGGLAASVFGLAFSAFVINQLHIGGLRFFLKNRKNYPNDLKTIFASYTDKTFLNIAKVTVVRDIVVTLGYCLFYIPGIIWQLQYFAVDYILAVRPDINRVEAFNLSKNMMKGHKADLVVLYISFIGWSLLTVFTCGILGVLYVSPYLKLTLTEFYSSVREDAINRGVISPFDVPDYPEYAPVPPVFNTDNTLTYSQQPVNNTVDNIGAATALVYNEEVDSNSFDNATPNEVAEISADAEDAEAVDDTEYAEDSGYTEEAEDAEDVVDTEDSDDYSATQSNETDTTDF